MPPFEFFSWHTTHFVTPKGKPSQTPVTESSDCLTDHRIPITHPKIFQKYTHEDTNMQRESQHYMLIYYIYICILYALCAVREGLILTSHSILATHKQARAARARYMDIWWL
jgi:hypothetical protein